MRLLFLAGASALGFAIAANGARAADDLEAPTVSGLTVTAPS